jgi:hypothetical protein
MFRFNIIFLALAFLFAPAMISAQSVLIPQEEEIHVIVKDIQGDRMEGYLRDYPKEITVSTGDKKEKSIPLKMIESIKVEKIEGAVPGADKLGAESYYSVQLHNSQEIFTLQKKYTFSLNTGVGIVTKTIDPETLTNSFLKDPSLAGKPEGNQSLIRDRNVILSLEVKF